MLEQCHYRQMRRHPIQRPSIEHLPGLSCGWLAWIPCSFEGLETERWISKVEIEASVVEVVVVLVLKAEALVVSDSLAEVLELEEVIETELSVVEPLVVLVLKADVSAVLVFVIEELQEVIETEV